jgi:K+-transporting ATPase ATPase C chain
LAALEVWRLTRLALIAVKLTILLTVLTGLVYPLAMYGLANLFFPAQARGSLVRNGDRVVGSELIGQNFSSPRYFHGRPSAAGEKGYDATSSGGSNLGPTNRALISAVEARVKAVLAENPGVAPGRIPVDLVTASGSGLDPEISVAAAELQVARVAKARNMDPQRVRELVRKYTRGRWAGIFGEPGVNVLMLNLALDRANATPPSR